MRKLVLISALIALFAITAAAADVAGKWVAQVPGREGDTMTWTFTFKVDAGKVSGTLTMDMMGQPMEQPISEGKIEGDNISFVTTMNFMDQERKTTWKGTVAGAEMKLTREMQAPPGGFGGGQGPGGGQGAGGGRGGMAREIVAKKVN
jgi:hypothetical protein